jgi:hypothetical protein
MAKFKMENFGGELPAVDNRLMPDNHASIAQNTWLFGGRIEPLHALVPIHTCVSPATRSVFRLPISSPSVDNMVNSYWLEFENQNVRVIRSPVTGQDQSGRYYWADGIYPKYMTGDMIKQVNAVMKGAWGAATSYNVNDGVTHAGKTWVAIQSGINHPPDTSPLFWIVMPTPYKLGIPAPPTAPGVTTTGGASATIQSRVYAYTWVSALGEEGAPSPPTLQSGKIDAVWHITMTAPLPADTADRNLTHTRIYRSVTGVQGVASYFFVAEVPIATLTYDDSQTDAAITLNEQLKSIEWDEPPVDLQGLVSMPNGMVAGWRKNEVWFCEPYYPHAWPLRYMIAVPNNIVALGVLGQTVMILTEGNPWSATGIDPSSMALAIIQPLEPCTARLSVVNTPNSVMYCSPNGLINLTASGAQNVTKDVILKDQWAHMLFLDSVCAAYIMQSYYAYSISQAGVFQDNTFQFDDPATLPVNEQAFQARSAFGTRPGIWLALGDPRPALTVLNPGPVEVMNLVTDIFNGEVMTVRRSGTDNPVVYLVDLRNEQNQTVYKWRSKMFKTDYLQNLGAAKVYWTPAVAPPKGDTVFRMYAAPDSQLVEDGLTLRFEEKLTKSGQMFRLPSGYKALYWQFEIEGYAFVDAIHVASSPRELREV